MSVIREERIDCLMFFKSILTKFLSQGRQKLWMKGRTKAKEEFIGVLRPEERQERGAV